MTTCTATSTHRSTWSTTTSRDYAPYGDGSLESNGRGGEAFATAAESSNLSGGCSRLPGARSAVAPA